MGQIYKQNSEVRSPSLKGHSVLLFTKFGNPPIRESPHNGFHHPRNFRLFHIFVLLISTYKYFRDTLSEIVFFPFLHLSYHF